jgi:pSer/pThr/pTyr-binding forkhead associated (FHA) protein
MQVKLKVLGGSHADREIPVNVTKFLIGRADECQLRPKSESVSRRHCIVVVKEGRPLIQDLGSRNGTFVNGKQLPSDKAKVLKAGDVLRVGKIEFEVVIELGIGGAKEPEIKSVAEAAARAREVGEESRFEEIDITTWLAEADTLDRKRQLGGSDTRQLRIDDTMQAKNDETEHDSSELSTGDSKDGSKDDSKPGKKQPGKLPAHLKQRQETSDSREAAGDALKRFFSGR